MEYPILPGAVVPPDVAYVMQRQNAMERHPHMVDRMPNQPVASVPMMRAVAPTIMRPVEYQQVMQPTMQIPTISSNYVHPANTARSGRKRTSCRLQVTIVVSVLLVCLTIGAGIAVWAVYGRGGDESSEDNIDSKVKIDDDPCDNSDDKDKNKHDGKNSDDSDEDKSASEGVDGGEDTKDKNEDEHNTKNGSKKKKNKNCI